MHRHPYRLVPRQRIADRLLILVAALGYRRWLSHPWQWTIRDSMVVVAGCAAGLVLFGFPLPMAILLLAFALAVFASLRLARHGFRLADIVMLLAVMLVTFAILLPAMERTRARTLGKRFYPFAVPQRYVELLYGRD